MATVEEKVYLNDSDDFVIKSKETQTSKNKLKKRDKFNCDPINDFISESNRKKFGHICNKCKNKNNCTKWQDKIILKCDDLRR